MMDNLGLVDSISENNNLIIVSFWKKDELVTNYLKWENKTKTIKN